ncbi:NEDD8-activating enzyme E1 regulatory subunit-like isoform X2 [Tigriopus californicus]|uniref:NEDD8-activating enzyme E1 regulatory subunit-like isoform X2 n=1 Tax=Tigriopus californicus TaxID=6832 RepID=UPI0027DA50CB|nr:NEDD8-activating enzyme E1 regulatory subunit-like isoform X2 [Tigriopus californicus]
MTSTPSPLGRPLTASGSLPGSPLGAEKTRRYDRQLRLWGDHGQTALEAAKLCLIHAGATGSEVLKSLVLPGVGAFTIVDGQRVAASDVGNNFFLEPESLGQPRGAAVAQYLLELNNEVRGDSVDETPEHILAHRPDFFKSFTLVVATDMSEKSLKQLSSLLWQANIPLMVVRAYGFISYIRLQVKEHTIVESHPDNEFPDLRLDQPFPALIQFMESQDMKAMDKHEHMHTPYVVILYKYLQKWKAEHGNQMPINYKEKKQFKETILEGVLKSPDGLPEDEENFTEAVNAVNTTLIPSKVPDEVQAILDDDQCMNLNLKSSDFWFIVRGIRDFLESTGHLPLKGTIPDMFSDSQRYIQLQLVYRKKADEDAEEVLKYVQIHLETAGRPAESISEAKVKSFCRNAFNLRLIRCGASIAEEFDGHSPNNQELGQILEQDPDSPAIYYVIFRGVDRFYSEHNVLPGVLDDQVEPDIGKLKNCVAKVLADCHLASVNISDDNIHEVCRYGGSELHAMASIIGGCAAQEVIKLITRQYVPISNLFLYNCMTSQTITLKV